MSIYSVIYFFGIAHHFAYIEYQLPRQKMDMLKFKKSQMVIMIFLELAPPLNFPMIIVVSIKFVIIFFNSESCFVAQFRLYTLGTPLNLILLFPLSLDTNSIHIKKELCIFFLICYQKRHTPSYQPKKDNGIRIE